MCEMCSTFPDTVLVKTQSRLAIKEVPNKI